MADAVEVTVNLGTLNRYSTALQENLRAGGSGPLRDGLRNAGVAYLDAMQQRFMRNSLGGGDWPQLSPRTLAIRMRRGKTGRWLKRRNRFSAKNSAILRETETIYRTLTPQFGGVPGQVARDLDGAVEVGIGGSDTHPRGNKTILQIARIHQFGTQHIPPRTIIVLPTGQIIDVIRSEVQAGYSRLVDPFRDL